MIAGNCLELLTLPKFLETIETNEATPDREKRQMNVFPAFIPDDQASHLAKPAHSPLDDPSMSPQFLFRFNAFASYARYNIPLPEALSHPLGIIGLVGMKLARPLSRSSNAA